MTDYEKLSIAIAFISGVISVVALIASNRSVKLTQAQVEVTIRDHINASMRRVEDFMEANADFLDQDEARLSDKDKKKRARLKAGAHSRIEGYLTALDGACGKYLDNKIDKIRFKKDYQREIRQAVQDESHHEYFKHGHGFNALMKVFKEWENPEE